MTANLELLNKAKAESTIQKAILLGITNDRNILAEVGVSTIRHGQLDHILRMTIKSLMGLSINDTIDATARYGSADLRKLIGKLAKQKFGNGEVLLKLQAILERARRATDKRNILIHSLWAHELDGKSVIRNKDHTWQTTPKTEEIQALSEEIVAITTELNRARLDGFLSEAIAKLSK